MVVNHDFIARLAYEIWETEGRPEDQADRHWRLAESVAPYLAPLIREPDASVTLHEANVPAVEAEPHNDHNSRDQAHEETAGRRRLSEDPAASVRRPEIIGKAVRKTPVPYTPDEDRQLEPLVRAHQPNTPRDYDAIRRAAPLLANRDKNSIKSRWKRIRARIDGEAKAPRRRPPVMIGDASSPAPQRPASTDVAAPPAPAVSSEWEAESRKAREALVNRIEGPTWPYLCQRPGCNEKLARREDLYCDAHRYQLRPIEISSRPKQASDPNAVLAKREEWEPIRQPTKEELMTGRRSHSQVD
jgi:hypothetical protein